MNVGGAAQPASAPGGAEQPTFSALPDDASELMVAFYNVGIPTCRDRQDRDTGPLLLATRRAANDCIVHLIGLLTDPADGQAYRETVKMMFERLGRKGLPTRTKDDHEKVAGILNARWQIFERRRCCTARLGSRRC